MADLKAHEENKSILQQLIQSMEKKPEEKKPEPKKEEKKPEDVNKHKWKGVESLPKIPGIN